MNEIQLIHQNLYSWFTHWVSHSKKLLRCRNMGSKVSRPLACVIWNILTFLTLVYFKGTWVCSNTSSLYNLSDLIPEWFRLGFQSVFQVSATSTIDSAPVTTFCIYAFLRLYGIYHHGASCFVRISTAANQVSSRLGPHTRDRHFGFNCLLDIS